MQAWSDSIAVVFRHVLPARTHTPPLRQIIASDDLPML